MAQELPPKADELIRLLGELGQAQERGMESDDLFARAVSLRDELARDLLPRNS